MSSKQIIALAMIPTSVLVVISLLQIHEDLFTGSISILDALHAGAYTVTLCSTVGFLITITKLLNAYEKGMNSTNADEIDNVGVSLVQMFNRLQLLCDLLMWSIVVASALSAVRHFLAGETGNAVMNLLLALFMVWLMHRGKGGGSRRSASELIGEKSRALRDKLVEAQKGMQPNPGPA